MLFEKFEHIVSCLQSDQVFAKMSYQGQYPQPSFSNVPDEYKGNWSPQGTPAPATLPVGEGRANTSFQIPPHLSQTAQQAFTDIRAHMDQGYFKTIPGCLGSMTVVRETFLHDEKNYTNVLDKKCSILV